MKWDRVVFDLYRDTVRKYGKLPLRDERKLIGRAKKGDEKAAKKLLSHLTGFFIFRIQTTMYYPHWQRHGEDALQDCLVLASRKIRSYRLRRTGKLKKKPKVRLSTYMWKGVTGVLLTHLKTSREIAYSDLSVFAGSDHDAHDEFSDKMSGMAFETSEGEAAPADLHGNVPSLGMAM